MGLTAFVLLAHVSTRSPSGQASAGPPDECASLQCGLTANKKLLPNGACICVPVSARGGACGQSFCDRSEHCCNASCGICVPIGGFCTEQICVSSE